MARSISASPATRPKSGTLVWQPAVSFPRQLGAVDRLYRRRPEDNPPMARWLTLSESGALFDIEVNASPILAAEMLRRNLWNVAYGCLVTSATLTALGTFDRFRMRAGLPKRPLPPWYPARFITLTPACCGCQTSRPTHGTRPRTRRRSFAICRRWWKAPRHPGAVLVAQADAGRVRRP